MKTTMFQKSISRYNQQNVFCCFKKKRSFKTPLFLLKILVVCLKIDYLCSMKKIIGVSTLCLLLLMCLPTIYLPNFVNVLCSKGFDKLAHATLFFAIFIICNGWKMNKIVFYTTFIFLAFAVEFLQYYIGRSCDLFDSLANLYGFFTANIFNFLILKQKK